MRRRAPAAPVVCFLVLLLLLSLFSPLGPTTARANTGSLSPAVLMLQAEPDGTATATVTVNDPNYRSFPEADAGWVTITPGAVSSSGPTYTVTASARGRKAGEVALARITFAVFPTPIDLPVVLTIGQQANLPPVLTYPARFDLGTVMPEELPYKQLDLWFSAPASGQITTDAPWLQVEPSSFAATQLAAVEVQPRPSSLTPGQTYTATVEIHSDTASVVKIPVTMRVADRQAPVPLPNPFADVPSGHWAQQAIMALSSWGVIRGLAPGQFGPDQAVTREQFARLLWATLHVPPVVPSLPSFVDVPTSRWSAPYIEAVKAWLPGDPDGRFHPETPVTRQDVAVALARAKGYVQDRFSGLFDVVPPDQDEISPSALGAVAFVLNRKLMHGFDDGTFRPTAFLTRAQSAVLLYSAVGPTPAQRAEASLAGVRLGERVTDVEAVLGAPEGESPGFWGSYTRVYRGGTVEVSYLSKWQVVSSVRLLKSGTTPRGLAIGDLATQVQWLYGQPDLIYHGRLFYPTQTDDGLYIGVDAGQVSWIELVLSK